MINKYVYEKKEDGLVVERFITESPEELIEVIQEFIKLNKRLELTKSNQEEGRR